MIYLGLGLLAALWIAWEDFKSREINIFAFVAFGLLGLLYPQSLLDPLFYLSRIFNLLIIGIMLCTIWLVFRNRGPVMDQKLGWGDVVMLLCLAIWLETESFLYLFTATTSLLVLGYFLLQKSGRLASDHPIPLAGWLSISFTLWAAFSLFL